MASQSAMVGSVPPRSKQIGPGSEPALSGPRLTFLVSGSTLRIMPAPAPIVSRCSVGTLSLKRSISGSFSIRVWPRVMTPMSKEVPPMSEQISESLPISLPT